MLQQLSLFLRFMPIVLLLILALSTTATANPWAAVEKLEHDQKYQSAQKQSDSLLARFNNNQDIENWTKALIKSTELRVGQNQWETATRFLQEQAWPDDAAAQSILHLYMANTLNVYLSSYSWEIQQRETLESKHRLDLKQMTQAQLLDAINQHFNKAYQHTSTLGDTTIPNALKAYFIEGQYPARIRGTLRDTVSYLWADFLKNEAFWSASHSNQTYRLDLRSLLGQQQLDTTLTDDTEHPLKRYVKLLSDLENWHLQAQRKEAALEAFRTRVRQLFSHFSGDAKRQFILKTLAQRIEQDRQTPWSTMAQWTLADLQRQLSRQDALILAHKTAQDCQQHFPQSQGAKNCTQLIRILTQPDFTTDAMRVDGLKKRAIRIRHKNINTLYFRAYPASLLPASIRNTNEQIPLLTRNTPSYTWTENLPETRDLRDHYSYSSPVIDQIGHWIILSSADSNFSDKQSPVQLTEFQTSGLVASTQPLDNQFEVTVYHGETGTFAVGATVELWERDYQQADKMVASVRTDHTGLAVLAPNTERGYYLKIRHKDDEIRIENLFYYRQTEVPERARSLIFTDRSIYRPQQSIQWKVVAYNGLAIKDNLQLLKNHQGWIRLNDSNGQVIAEEKITTNAYGSASGAFLIPQGKKLGHWSLQSSWSGHSSIRVEEYKRPTFNVSFEDSAQSMRLNQLARLTGKADYYFGRAVTNASVSWRVTRRPVYDWRMGWHGPSRNGKTETIASGENRLDKEGKFTISFLPKADESDDNQGVSYLFDLSADVTDEGGETRSSKRTFRLGSIAIAASLEATKDFVLVGETHVIKAKRFDLNQTPRTGTGTWRLHKLIQPQQAQLPTELINTLPQEQQAFATQGDRQNPRWETNKKIEDYMKGWQESTILQQGTLQHADNGFAELSLQNLQPGIYRLHYQTQDRWGKTFSTQLTLFVADTTTTEFALPLLLKTQVSETEAGNSIEILAGTHLKSTPVKLEVFHRNQRLQQTILKEGIQHLSFPVNKTYRGGLTFVISTVSDYQYLSQQQFVNVPWNDKKLQLSFSSFRDKLRPGEKETWRISVKDHQGKVLSKDAIELLASMYDKSLDFFTPHSIPSLNHEFLQQRFYQNTQNNLGQTSGAWNRAQYTQSLSHPTNPTATQLKALRAHYRDSRMASGIMEMSATPAPSPMMMQKSASPTGMVMSFSTSSDEEASPVTTTDKPSESTEFSVRKHFNETAFFFPHLVVDEKGEVSFEFEVPESLTEWKVWVAAIGKDLQHGQLQEQVNTSKELMIRPYLPRFLREGDRAEIQVSVNNTSDSALNGQVDFEIYDPASGSSLADAFALDQTSQNFAVAAKDSTTLIFRINAPNVPGMVGIRAKAHTETFSDGEQHPLPVLPSRIHLAQSRFVALTDQNTKTLHFDELASTSDASRINKQLVITVDGQLFYAVLNALPYLVDYPYECTEQTLNRFLSTSIVNRVFKDHPSVASMAKKLASRKTQLPTWNKEDPNRKLQLEETPWLVEASGGEEPSDRLLRILDPEIAAQQQVSALEKLQKMQTSSGGFPWWEGGPPSPYMTAYLLQGFSRALEFKVDVPKRPIQRAWHYLHQEYGDKLKDENHLHTLTFINYLLSSYPDSSWTNNLFNNQERKIIMNQSFKHWRELSPLLKSYLALTLNRAGRHQDATLVFESLMDIAKHDEQLGTYWAPEDRSWLWYNDTVETHAFLLRTLAELRPNDARRKGMVQWLMLDKKLSHWKSTRATAESIYALTHYLQQDDLLDQSETLHITVGNQASKTIRFTPDEYTGNNQQTVIEGEKITPDMANITLKKDTENLMFASATWHFSTETLPTEAQGDFFKVNRQLFKRVHQKGEWVLQPLQQGAKIHVGDLLEVQLSLQTKHTAEYVHLRAPRGAGFEPDAQSSGYRWQTGLGYFEEVRDSGVNYFFERLPQGEYRFTYRVRATTAGSYRMAPAQIQSMYAPEFTAYSAGTKIIIQAK